MASSLLLAEDDIVGVDTDENAYELLRGLMEAQSVVNYLRLYCVLVRDLVCERARVRVCVRV